MVQQVRIVGILNAVQGGLEIMMALVLLLGAVGLPLENRQQNKFPDEETLWIVFAAFVISGLVVMFVGALRILAGLKNWNFRGRTLAIASLVVGIAPSMLSCYCAPTSLTILIYGLTVLMHPSVEEAFRMAAKGASAEQIVYDFSPYRSR